MNVKLGINQYNKHGKGNSPSRAGMTALWTAFLAIAILTTGCKSLFNAPKGLERVQNTGMLRIAIDPSFAPFESINAEGQIIGFDADLGVLIAEQLGVQAHFVTTGYDALYDALTAGRADVIISALYPDPSRSDGFTSTTAYFDAGNVLLVPANSPITGQDDLAGMTVTFQFGTDAHMQALEGEETLQPAPVLLPMDDATGVTVALLDGTADAALLDRVSALYVVHENPTLVLLPEAISEEPYVVTARDQDRDLLNAIQDTLDELDAQGEIDVLIERWMH